MSQENVEIVRNAMDAYNSGGGMRLCSPSFIRLR